MNTNALTWSVLIAAAFGAGWTWLQRDAEVDRRAEHSREHASRLVEPAPVERARDASPEDLQVPVSHRETFDLSMPPPGATDSIDVESFWRDARPVEAEELEPLLAELEVRLRLFSAMCANFASADRPTSQAPAQASDEFFSQYAGVALAETQFLIDECVAGQVRVAPFTPLPPSVLGGSDATVQLVPHLAAAGGLVYVARLERSEHPTLFEQRRKVNSLAQLLSLSAGTPRTPETR